MVNETSKRLRAPAIATALIVVAGLAIAIVSIASSTGRQNRTAAILGHRGIDHTVWNRAPQPGLSATASLATITTATPSDIAPSRHTASSFPVKTSPPPAATNSAPPPGGNYRCVQIAAQGKCYYSADQYITGADGDPYLNQNIWAGDGTYKQTLYGASPENWYVVANANTHFGGVLTYPNVGFNMAGTVDSKGSVTSSWSTSIPHNAQTAAWAAYDLWFNNWADEVMIQTDLAVNSYYDCSAVATATVGGMPWHMCRFDAERVWKPGTDDHHLLNQASGSIDVKAILVWMEQHGQLPTNSTWTAGSYGFEVCDTGGTDEKLAVTGFTWHSS